MRIELIRSRQASRSPDSRETAVGVVPVEGEGEEEGGGLGVEIPRRMECRL